ncbi:MFS transporter [Lichenibacterium dinghuense]|uniref:MFS transporter n=1 Tax=Lichenibacterium dinghuense TaxID=2895977 RepID=UPI001F014A5C|nr:MFS transporter [Lichenibacterium sp. 6Y81]
MDVKPLLALGGVLLATMASEFNDQVSAIALVDIRGGFGIGHDPGTWIDSLYTSAEIVGMALSPWFLVTLTHRLWAIGVIAGCCLFSVLIPFSPNIEAIYALRILEGLFGGLMVPLLMATALRVLTPDIRLYGLAVYALTATFTPGLAATLAAFWLHTLHAWQFIFFEPIPFCALGALLVWYGLPQDPPVLKRFAMLDWRGLILLVVGTGALSTLLLQGDRLDWFNSPFISVLALVSALAIPLLLVNEWFHPLPFLKLQMLGKRNFAYGAVGLFTFLLIAQSGSTVPLQYLQEVQGYRPVQAQFATLVVSAGQIVMLPLMALLLDNKWADARAVSLVGMALILASCIGSSSINVVWNRDQFYLWQALQAVGQPMVVMPLLMMATNTVTKETDGPFASALINFPRAVAEAAGTWLLELITRWRGALHSVNIVDQVGRVRWPLVQGSGVLPTSPPPLLADGQPRAPGSLEAFNRIVEQQVTILTTADTYLILGAITVALMVIVCVLPVRTLPPRLQFSKS